MNASKSILMLLCILLLSGCSSFQAPPAANTPTVDINQGGGVFTQTPSLPPTAVPTQPLAPTDTSAPRLPPAATATQPPVPTQAPVVTATSPAAATLPPVVIPTQLPVSADTTLVTIYLVAIGDNGQSGTKFGCDDSLVPVKVEIPATQGILKATLNKLLSIKDQFYGQSGLYNALYQSSLQLESVAIISGVAKIALTGQMQLGGECDNPRVLEQLMTLPKQFSTVSSVEITLNGKPLQEALSLK